MSHHVMLDLETLGTGRDAVILSIGAARFDPNGWDVVDSFEVHIDPIQSQALGRTIDAGTVLWWMAQERQEARDVLLEHKDTWVDVMGALDAFAEWFGTESVPVWGNSAAFDNEKLISLYQSINWVAPWEFRHDRCYRTMKNMAPEVELERVGTHHSAVGDAISQAMHLQAVLRHLGIKQ